MTSNSTSVCETRHLCHAGRGPSAAGSAGEARFMLRGLSPVGVEGDEPPARFKIANWGLEKFRGGSVLVNHEAVTEIRRRMAANRVDRVRLDVAHKTAFKPSEGMMPEDILGYGDLEAVEGDGLYLCNATWTPRGKSLWKALPDPSPAFYSRKTDSMMTQLDSVGLCPNGELELPRLCSADQSPSPAPAVTPPGTYLNSVTPEIMTKTLIAMLQKAGQAVPEKGAMSDADYDAKLTQACTDYCGGGEGEGGGAGGGETKEQLSAREKAMDDRLTKLENNDQQRQRAADRAAKEEIMRKCSAEGKVMPFTDDQIYGKAGSSETGIALSALEAAYGNLKQTVEVKGAGAGNGRQGDQTKTGEQKTVLSADGRKIAGIMGVSVEDLDKFAPVAAA